jgi:hypothetical protein
MIFSKLDAPRRYRRSFFGLIAGLSLLFLSGCGAAWQPDPRDKPQNPSGLEGSGLYGPEMQDSRTHL